MGVGNNLPEHRKVSAEYTREHLLSLCSGRGLGRVAPVVIGREGRRKEQCERKTVSPVIRRSHLTFSHTQL